MLCKECHFEWCAIESSKMIEVYFAFSHCLRVKHIKLLLPTKPPFLQTQVWIILLVQPCLLENIFDNAEKQNWDMKTLTWKPFATCDVTCVTIWTRTEKFQCSGPVVSHRRMHWRMQDYLWLLGRTQRRAIPFKHRKAKQGWSNMICSFIYHIVTYINIYIY